MNFGIWTNSLYNGEEIDNWKKRIIVDNFEEINEWVESFQQKVDNGEVLHIHNEWNDENITESVLEDLKEYKKLKEQLEYLNIKYQ